MDNYVPIEAPRIEGFPLLLSTAEAREADFHLDVVLSHTSREPACIVETRAEYFSSLVPNDFHTSPMWILWLPDEFSDEIHLHEGFPLAWDVETRDLMERHVVLDWPMKHKTVRVQEHFLLNSINAAGIWPHSKALPLVIVLATPSHLALYATWIDEATITDLQVRGLNSGENYRPYRRYSEEELKEAAKEAVLHGNRRNTDYEGRPLVWLPSYTYRKDK